MPSTPKTSPVVAVMLMLGLGACSSGPSPDDVREALEREFFREQLTELEVLGCKPAGEACTCDIVYSTVSEFVSMNDVPIAVRTRRADDGWRIVGLGGTGQ